MGIRYIQLVKTLFFLELWEPKPTKDVKGIKEAVISSEIEALVQDVLQEVCSQAAQN